jgi:mRNA-degrading endonuclease RelE of RelBE toxin-antitoxin system
VNFNVVYTNEFKKEIKRLSKKYPSLPSDFSAFLQHISENPFSGTSLGNKCYKVRLAIKSKGKGKSGGARIITYVQIIEETVILISIYDKSALSSISEAEIKERLKKYLG